MENSPTYPRRRKPGGFRPSVPTKDDLRTLAIASIGLFWDKPEHQELRKTVLARGGDPTISVNGAVIECNDDEVWDAFMSWSGLKAKAD